MSYISVSEYAKKHGVNRSAIGYLIKHERIPYIKGFRRYLIEEDTPYPERLKSGPKPADPDKTREFNIYFSCTQREKERFIDMAKLYGMSVSKYVRKELGLD